MSDQPCKEEYEAKRAAYAKRDQTWDRWYHLQDVLDDDEPGWGCQFGLYLVQQLFNLPEWLTPEEYFSRLYDRGELDELIDEMVEYLSCEAERISQIPEAVEAREDYLEADSEYQEIRRVYAKCWHKEVITPMMDELFPDE